MNYLILLLSKITFLSELYLRCLHLLLNVP